MLRNVINRGLALLLSTLFILLGCICPPEKRYRGQYLNITKYKYSWCNFTKTPKGVRVHDPKKNVAPAFLAEVDKKTDELEECLTKIGKLTKPVERDWFAVLLAPDWYVSTCSGEQLVPSKLNYKVCESKNLTIPEKCRYVEKPTKDCPCPCNARAAIQDNRIIVVTPNLKLYKAELTRMLLWPKYNSPWVEPVSQCLK